MIRASCGPALRYRRARMLMMNMSARTERPTRTQISIIRDISNISPPKIFRALCVPTSRSSFPIDAETRHAASLHSISLLAAYFFPAADISNAFLVTGDYYFGIAFDGGAVFTRSGTGPPASGFRRDVFARAAFADRAGDTSDHPDHFVVGGINERFGCNHFFGEESDHDAGANQAD